MSAKEQIDVIVTDLEIRRNEVMAKLEALAKQADVHEAQLKAIDRALSKARVLQSDIEEAGDVETAAGAAESNGVAGRELVTHRVIEFLRANPGKTGLQIANALSLRTQQVSNALSTGRKNGVFEKHDTQPGWPTWSLATPTNGALRSEFTGELITPEE